MYPIINIRTYTKGDSFHPIYNMNKENIQEALSKYKNHLKASGVVTTEETEKGIRCVLFDMDGVLYNSMPNHAIAWTKCMRQFGIRMTTEDAYATEGARGIDTIRDFAGRQLNKNLTPEEAQKIYDVKTDYFHQLPTATIFAGVIDLMRKIKVSGVTIGVVTGSGQRPLIKRLLHDFGEFLDEKHIVTAYDVTRGKPYPDPYLMGLRKCGNCQPWQGIVIENAPLGVRSGVAANIFTVAVNSGPLPDSALTKEGANLIYKKMTQFCDDWDILVDDFKRIKP